MKRLLTLLLALTLVLALGAPALAADGDSIIASGASSTTSVNFSVGSSFTVTIPDLVTIVPGVDTYDMQVTLQPGAILEIGKTIKVDYTLANGFNSAQKVGDVVYGGTLVGSSANDVIWYKLERKFAAWDDGDKLVDAADWFSADPRTSVFSQYFDSRTQLEGFYGKLRLTINPDQALYSGTYTDTMTFTVSYDGL